MPQPSYVMALKTPTAEELDATLDEGMKKYLKICEEKLGIVPNVLLSYASRPAKLKTFVSNRQSLRDVGFSDEEIFDIADTAGFFNMSNRVATVVDMMPNPEYHGRNR